VPSPDARSICILVRAMDRPFMLLTFCCFHDVSTSLRAGHDRRAAPSQGCHGTGGRARCSTIEQDGFTGNFDALQATDPLKIAHVADRKYKMLLWNLSLFFSVVLERRRFSTIGFNSPYDWSDPDLHISKTQLLTKFQEIAICDQASFHKFLSDYRITILMG
ncbi:Dynein beta chain, ciliary, partial [Giardia duodenalis]